MKQQCEAISECTNSKRDVRCPEDAIAQVHGGRWVCWVHGSRYAEDSGPTLIRFIVRDGQDCATPWVHR